MQKLDLPPSFTKLNENCGLPDIFTDYQIRHLGNPSGLPEILLKIDPWYNFFSILCNSLHGMQSIAVIGSKVSLEKVDVPI